MALLPGGAAVAQGIFRPPVQPQYGLAPAPYQTPQAAEAQIQGPNANATQALLHAARLRYARSQMNAYRKVAHLIQPQEQSPQFASLLQGADPIHDYAAASAAFTAAAKAAGYADPRIYLRQLLSQARGPAVFSGGGGRPMLKA